MSSESPFPVINNINRLVQKKWPSTKNRSGKLYWYGHDGIFGGAGEIESATWVLDGMAPVGAQFVVKELEREGCDMAFIKTELDRYAAKAMRKENRRQRLVASAKTKLTPQERQACGI